MSARGHGELGLLDYLRTFADLADDTGANRRPFLDYFPGALMTAGAWVVDSGRTYVQRAHFVFADGMLRDVVGVETDLGTLTRVETLADCRATAGTFFADIDAARILGVPYYDDGTTTWDGGALFDQTLPLDLYVHLAGDADPNGLAVLAILGFYFGTIGETHPALGPDKLTNGALESLTGWTESLSGAGNTTSLDTALFIGRGSAASLKLLSAGTAVGNATRFQDVPTVVGAIYRLSGYYQTDPAFTAGAGNVSARLLIGDVAGTLMLYEDGRCSDASGLVDMRQTYGQWRRFLFDFIAVATTTRVQLRLRIGGAASAAQLNFDGVKLQRVFRYVYYEPRLTADAFGDVEVGSQSIYFGTKEIGISNVGLVNADGFLDKTLGQLYTSNRVARVAVGGSFDDLSELYRDHWRDSFYGLSRGELWASDQRVDIGLEDPIAQILDTYLPIKTYALAEFPNMDLNREGYAQPIVLGNFIQTGIVTRDAVFLNRIDVTAAGYGVYHLADTTNTPDGLGASTPIVYQYLPGHADVLHGYPIRLLTSGIHYTWDRTTGRLTVLRDIRTYRFDQAGDAFGYYGLDFNIGAGTLTAGASADDSEQQATDLTTSWTAAAGVAITWTYSTVTHKFTVTKGAGTLNLLCKTGSALSQGMWERLGFRTDADRTGALTYTADNAVFSNPETDHLMAAMIEGIRDDAAGTYTGTPSSTIIRPAEMFKFILRVYLGQAVDEASILQARNASNIAIQECREYLGAPTSIRDLFGRLAAAGVADVVVDGSGVWYYRLYSTIAPIMAAFTSADFIDFRSGRRPADVFKAVELVYGQRPLINERPSKVYTIDPSVPTKHGRYDVLEIQTSRALANGQLDELGQIMALLAAAGPRIVEFSARGKLVDLLPGDKVTITRARGLDATGALNTATFRIIAIRSGLTSGVSSCVAVEDVPFSH